MSGGTAGYFWKSDQEKADRPIAGVQINLAIGWGLMYFVVPWQFCSPPMEVARGVNREMNYNLRFERRSEYLYVYVEVFEVNYEVMREYCLKIAEAAGKFPGRRVLVEKAAAGQLSLVEAYRLASELPSMGFGGIKMALVDHAENNQEINKFAETVSYNRGMTVSSFEHVHAAERWLLSH